MKSPPASDARNQSAATFRVNRLINGMMFPDPHPHRPVTETKSFAEAFYLLEGEDVDSTSLGNCILKADP
jgi:hypothetical protein